MQSLDGDFAADSSVIELLFWEQPEKVRAAGRELLREHFPWDSFGGPWDIHPDKACWDGIAEALCEMDDETLSPHLTQVWYGLRI